MLTEILNWMSGGAVVVITFVVVVSVSAMAIHVLRERAARRGREGAMLHPRKPSPEVEAETAGRMKQYAKAEEAARDALGWSPSTAENAAMIPEKQSAEGLVAPVAKPSKTILIADDDPMIAFALKKRLQRLGYDVLRSPDSAHALLGAMKTSPDLVVLDVNMPGGNGLAVCEMMATDPQNAAIPVIVHTSRNDEATKERCRHLGARYVEKSSKSWEEIQSLVTDLLGRAETAPAPSPPDVYPQLLSPVCGHPRVLCIDGDKGELAPIEQHLAALGVEVLESNDLEEGFWTCFSEKPHVVVIHADAPLPEVQAALYRFTQHPVTRNLPVLLIKNKGVQTAELTEGLPETKSLKILDSSVGWTGLWRELEKIIPIAGADNPDLLVGATPVAGRPGQDDYRVVGQVANLSHGDDDRAFNESAEPSQSEDSPRRLKILCIDDDPVIAKSIALRVQPYGIELKEAADGTQGFHLGLRERPDLILLDLQIPEGDGHYVLSKFRNHPLTKDIPVVILTVEANAGVRRKLISLEAAGFLSKPVRWKEFFGELGRFVNLPKKLIADYKLSEEELPATT
ncbi:MAG: response regulator [Planctomycetes bacterium]|nr:response regulator [Planctomycetota bacterium]MCG2682870.1 response regulator [Planctomycetales bacterium]